MKLLVFALPIVSVPALADVERLLPQAPAATRPSMLLFHILTNRIFAAEHRSPNAQEFLRRHAAEAFSPGPEAVIVGTYMGEVDWPLVEDRIAQSWELAAPAGLLEAGGR